MALDIATRQVVYPESDGQPIADNTKQFRWITIIKGGLDTLFQDRDDVFVAGDLLWYPVEGATTIRRAPDAMVVSGRPKGDRGSYLQWLEGDIAPQIVFEVLSPGNTLREFAQKLDFYDTYGVEEYYLYDPDKNDLTGWQRQGVRLIPIEQPNGWQSPLLGLRFQLDSETLHIIRPDGQEFLDYVELERQRVAALAAAEQANQRAEQANLRAERLAKLLREQGLDPDTIA
ncbi:MAG: Uma2 family endonuclease [Roseiflexaceae bacterium]